MTGDQGAGRSGGCTSCVPRACHYHKGCEHAFPAVWQPLRGHPRWILAPWLIRDDRLADLRFCRDCGTVWYVRYEWREDRYEITELPQGIEAVFCLDGRLDDVLRLVGTRDRGPERFLASYFQRASYDRGHAAGALVCMLAVAPLEPGTAQRVVGYLADLTQGGQTGAIDIPSLEPLVTLFDRHDVWRVASGEAKQPRPPGEEESAEWYAWEAKSLTRDRVDRFVAYAFAPPTSPERAGVRTSSQDRDALLAMSGAENRLERAFRMLELALEDGSPGRAMEAVAELSHLQSLRSDALAPGQVEALAGLPQTLGARTGDREQACRWVYLRRRAIGILYALQGEYRLAPHLRGSVDQALARDPN